MVNPPFFVPKSFLAVAATTAAERGKKKCFKASWRRCYYPHRSRDSLSPVCGIFKLHYTALICTAILKSLEKFFLLVHAFCYQVTVPFKQNNCMAIITLFYHGNLRIKSCFALQAAAKTRHAICQKLYTDKISE